MLSSILQFDSVAPQRARGRFSLAVALLLSTALATTVAIGPASAIETPGDLGRPGVQQDLSGGDLLAGQSPLGKYLAARHAEVEGDLAAAAELLTDVLRDYPDRTDILARAQAIMAAEGRIEEAMALARRLVELDQEAPVANLTLVAHDIKNGAYDAAVERLAGFGQNGANRLLVPLLQAWALAGAGDIGAALESLQSLAQSAALVPTEALHAGLIADLAGSATEAEAAFRRAGDGAVPLRIAEAHASFLSRQGRLDEARRVLGDFVEARPQDLLLGPAIDRLQVGGALDPLVESASEGAAEAFFSVASILSRDGVGSGAGVFIHLALDMNPNNPMYQLLLADILNNQGRPAAAQAAYGAVPKDSPYAWPARLNIARIQETEGKLDAAVALLREMVEERPARTDAASALGDLLRFNDRFNEAANAYDVAIDRIGVGRTPDWRLLYSRGIALERSKQWLRAEADFLQALEQEPDQPHVLNYLGYSWVEQGLNLDRARAMIEKAVAQRPRDGFITDSLGWAAYRLGDYDEAVRHLERAVSLEPGDPIINDHLGDAYWLVGRLDEALKQWRRALDREPTAELADTLKAKLEGRERPSLEFPEGRDS